MDFCVAFMTNIRISGAVRYYMQQMARCQILQPALFVQNAHQPCGKSTPFPLNPGVSALFFAGSPEDGHGVSVQFARI
jgi:hypothetical protein